MSNWYKHEREEAAFDRHEGHRPKMPLPSPSVEREMRHYLRKRKLSYRLAKENGWYGSKAVDNYDRIIIPCSNSAGIPYYQARAIDNWTYVRYNSPPVRRNDSVVLVWPRMGASRRGALVVEGPVDSLAGAMCGYVSFGLMGNEPPQSVVEYMVTLIKGVYEPAVIVPDLDHLEMGPWMLGTLGANGIKAEVRIPFKKDLAEMSIWQRKKLLA